MAGTSPWRQIASDLLAADVADWIDAQRSDGLSYRVISLRLAEVTKGRVMVTEDTISRWHKDGAA